MMTSPLDILTYIRGQHYFAYAGGRPDKDPPLLCCRHHGVQRQQRIPAVWITPSECCMQADPPHSRNGSCQHARCRSTAPLASHLELGKLVSSRSFRRMISSQPGKKTKMAPATSGAMSLLAAGEAAKGPSQQIACSSLSIRSKSTCSSKTAVSAV